MPGTCDKGLVGPNLPAIISITTKSCDLDVSDRKTSVVCEDKLIWFIAGYLVDAVYDSVRHRYGVPTPSGDIFF